MSEFSLSFAKYKDKTDEQIDKVVRATAIGLLSDIVMDVPVDSGRARGSILLSIDNIDNTVTQNTDKNGSATINRAINKLQSNGIGKYIYIQSNLDYIEKIEYGGSPVKAPKGFFRVNIARWRAKIS